MARKHGDSRLAAVFVLSCCALVAPTAVSAGTIAFTSFTGPTDLVTGSQGTYQLEVELLGVGTTIVTNFGGGNSVTSSVGYPTFTFNSAEGETVSMSPLSSPFSGPYSINTTFTFENPGSYLVSAFGSVTTQNTTQQVVQIPKFVFDPNCACNVQVGFDTRIDISTSTKVEFAAGTLRVNVSDPQPVPDPASTLLLLGAGAVSLMWMRRRETAGK